MITILVGRNDREDEMELEFWERCITKWQDGML